MKYRGFDIKISGKLFKVEYPDGRPFTMRFLSREDATSAVDRAIDGPPVVQIKPVTYYGCVRCQTYHYEDTEPDIYNLHYFWQSKHGTKQTHETLEQRKQRYEERFSA